MDLDYVRRYLEKGYPITDRDYQKFLEIKDPNFRPNSKFGTYKGVPIQVTGEGIRITDETYARMREDYINSVHRDLKAIKKEATEVQNKTISLVCDEIHQGQRNSLRTLLEGIGGKDPVAEINIEMPLKKAEVEEI